MTEPAPESTWKQEGQVKFQVGTAFYRDYSRLSRDLAVLAATIYRQRQRQLRVLDAMSGCGVRALRYGVEAGADFIWANEANPDQLPQLTHNLGAHLPHDRHRITQQDASCLFFHCHQQQDYYDIVDVDSFGAATPYVNTSLWAVRLGGLIYLADTDSRTSSGHNPEHAIAAYGAYPRLHPAFPEQGLRILIGAIWQQAAARGFGIQPIFSLFHDGICRVMVQLVPKFSRNLADYGYLAYCPDCGDYQRANWRRLSRTWCQYHDEPRPMVLSGPMWLGPLHDRLWVETMRAIAQDWGWSSQAELLSHMAAEARMPPWYYPLGEIGRHLNGDLPRRDRLLEILSQVGYAVSRTAIDAQAIKTTAPLPICVELLRQAD